MSVAPAVAVEQLVKRYGDLEAVAGASFAVDHGEIFGLLGPNGAGKTTTLEIVEGLRQPDSGAVSVLGESPHPRNPALLRRIGVQLQASAFFEHLTAFEQLEAWAALFDTPRERCRELLGVVGLTDSAGVRTERLSGGQQQRLSIAAALVHGPELVFLDEPTGALDPQARANLWDLIRSIRERGATVILTTHSMEEAERLCDRVAIIDQGRILTMGSPGQLVRDLDAPTRISVRAAAVSLDGVRALDGVLAVGTDGERVVIETRDPAAVLTGLGRADALADVTVSGARLEDVFLQLTGREYRA